MKLSFSSTRMCDKSTNMKSFVRNRGYIALLSTIIIGAVLLTITVGAGQSGWFTRFAVLGAEAKFQSHTLASGCINQALATVLVNPKWNGNATTTYSYGSCYVYPLQKHYPHPHVVTIKAQGVVRGAITNVVSEFNMADIHIDESPEAVPVPPPQSSPDVVPTVDSFLEVTVMP